MNIKSRLWYVCERGFVSHVPWPQEDITSSIINRWNDLKVEWILFIFTETNKYKIKVMGVLGNRSFVSYVPNPQEDISSSITSKGQRDLKLNGFLVCVTAINEYKMMGWCVIVRRFCVIWPRNTAQVIWRKILKGHKFKYISLFFFVLQL